MFPDALNEAWLDKPDFADSNPLISSILNCISQITGVAHPVIVLSREPVYNFTLRDREMGARERVCAKYEFLCNPPETPADGTGRVSYEDAKMQKTGRVLYMQNTEWFCHIPLQADVGVRCEVGLYSELQDIALWFRHLAAESEVGSPVPHWASLIGTGSR